VLRGAGADEAPEVYRKLEDVLAPHGRHDRRRAHAPPAHRRHGGLMIAE
jgi:hypothetical protein